MTGTAIITALDDAGNTMAIKVNEAGELVTATATTALSITLLDKLDTIITRLEAVEAAVNAP